MNISKKSLALLLTVVLCLCLGACSTTVEDEATTIVTTTDVVADITTTKAVTSSTTEKATTEKATQATTKKAEATTKAATTKKQSTTTTTTKVSTTKASKCAITIDCSSVLSNMDELKPGHSNYVPANGVILNSNQYTFNEGDTVYDVLKKACADNKININSQTTVYGTYVAGINNLDEFDCGKESGWKYMVNGEYPNVSCSKYPVKNGDKIVFEYVCSY